MAVVVGQRNIKDTPFNNKCYAVDATLDLALYTLKICSNEKIFTPEYKETITDNIIELVLSIYLNAYSANKIYVSSDSREWIERDSKQRASILKCETLLAYINLAKRAFHLRSKKVDFWVRKTISTRNLLKKWNDADYERHYTR